MTMRERAAGRAVLTLFGVGLITGRWLADRYDRARFWLGAWTYQAGKALVCLAMTMNGNGMSYAEAQTAWLDMIERARRSRREEAEHG